MENKELSILMEEMKIRVRGDKDPNNYTLLFALEMGLKPVSKSMSVPVHPDDIARAFYHYLKKKGLSTDFNKGKLFQSISRHAPTKTMRFRKSKKGKGRAMTPVKMVNPCSAIFDLLKEIDSVESVQE